MTYIDKVSINKDFSYDVTGGYYSLDELEELKDEINEVLAEEMAKEFSAMEGDDDCEGGACKI
ncbi:MAG: hypothetical protein ACRCVU_13910 [Flavobacterium sp.]